MVTQSSGRKSLFSWAAEERKDQEEKESGSPNDYSFLASPSSGRRRNGRGSPRRRKRPFSPEHKTGEKSGGKVLFFLPLLLWGSYRYTEREREEKDALESDAADAWATRGLLYFTLPLSMRNAAVAKSGRRGGRSGKSWAKSGLLFFLAPSSLSTLSTPRGGMEATPTRDREHEGGDADWVVGVGVVVGEQVEWAPCRGEPQSQCSGGEGQSGEPQLCGLPSPRNGEFARRKRPGVRAAICRRRQSFPPGARILLAGQFLLGSAAFSPLKVFLCPLENFCRFVCFSSFRTICPSDPGLSC